MIMKKILKSLLTGGWCVSNPLLFFNTINHLKGIKMGKSNKKGLYQVLDQHIIDSKEMIKQMAIKVGRIDSFTVNLDNGTSALVDILIKKGIISFDELNFQAQARQKMGMLISFITREVQTIIKDKADPAVLKAAEPLLKSLTVDEFDLYRGVYEEGLGAENSDVIRNKIVELVENSEKSIEEVPETETDEM